MALIRFFLFSFLVEFSFATNSTVWFSTETNGAFDSVFSVSEDIAFACGLGTFQTTSDGGGVWQPMVNPLSNSEAMCTSIVAADGIKVWLAAGVGVSSLQNSILHSNDTGKIWTTLFEGSDQFFQAVDIIDQGATIFAAGFGPLLTPVGFSGFGPLIIWSNTSGVTWQTVNLTDPIIPSFSHYQVYYAEDELSSGELMDISIGTSQDIYAVGWIFTLFGDNAPSALVYASHDGGSTFQQQKNPITVQNPFFNNTFISGSKLFGVEAYNASHVFAVGFVDTDVNTDVFVSRFPTVIVTTYGGRNWTAIEFKNKSLTGAIFVDLSIVSPDVIYVSASNSSHAFVVFTTDGFSTLEIQILPNAVVDFALLTPVSISAVSTKSVLSVGYCSVVEPVAETICETPNGVIWSVTPPLTTSSPAVAASTTLSAGAIFGIAAAFFLFCLGVAFIAYRYHSGGKGSSAEVNGGQREPSLIGMSDSNSGGGSSGLRQSLVAADGSASSRRL